MVGAVVGGQMVQATIWATCVRIAVANAAHTSMAGMTQTGTRQKKRIAAVMTVSSGSATITAIEMRLTRALDAYDCEGPIGAGVRRAVIG